MANGDKMTRKQHYIPQVYLRGFSTDDKNIFFFNLASSESSKIAVPIKSICYKQDLYEARTEQGNYLLENHIEHALENLERRFSDFRTRLEHKAFLRENYETQCFLDSEEKSFWITYLCVQIFRSPKVLSIAKDFCKKALKNNINMYRAENIALSYCLPFFTGVSEESVSAINSFLNPMLNMNINIGVVQGNEELFTSDNPVYIHANWPCKEYDKIVFPISSKLCLFMYGGEDKKTYGKNRLVPIDKEMLRNIYWSIAYRADNMIFSARHLDRMQEKKIRRIHKLRLKDDKEKFRSSEFE